MSNMNELVEANVNNGDGNGNGNGNPNVKNGGVVPVTKECTYQEFMKSQPLSFKGTEGVMVLKEEDKVKKYIGCLTDNIQGNVIAAELYRLPSDCNPYCNNIMGPEQQPFKRQNVNGPSVARAYTVRNNVERRGCVGALPYWSKLPDYPRRTVAPGVVCNCKRVVHMDRVCTIALLLPLRRLRLEIRREIFAMSVEDHDIIEMSVPS
ncbi:hypothetical protein Tco_0971644 [Tanacetum coccineum]